MNNTIYGGTTTTPTPLAIADQTYDPTSTNAQSGKAVSEAIDDVKLPISKGSGKGSTVINEGVASGDYSIAGGTTDKEFIEDLVGATVSAITKLNKPEAQGALSISLGADNITQSGGSVALGYKNISGAKGYYFDDIDFTNKTITLSTTRRTSTLLTPTYPSSVDWEVGDRLFIVNDDRYFLTISAVNENIITVEELPFSEIMYSSTLSLYTYSNPCDRTIVNIDKPKSGSVIVGWGAIGIGAYNTTIGNNSYSAGYQNSVVGDFGAAFGQENVVGYSAFATGMKNKALGKTSFAEGHNTSSIGLGSHSEGGETQANGNYSHAEGKNTQSTAYASHSEGVETKAKATASHAEGQTTNATGIHSHTEGHGTSASGEQSHAEGQKTIASGNRSHAEGKQTVAAGLNSHAEGCGSLDKDENGNYKYGALGENSHTEGLNAKASNTNSHAEGNTTTASGIGSHAEGKGSTASNDYAHAEGYETHAGGRYSHTSGKRTKTTKDCQFAMGQFNSNKTDTLLEVGNGTSEENRSNAFEAYKDGHAEVQKQGETENSVVIKQYVDNKIASLNNTSFDFIYPVNSIYITADDKFNPETYFGGVWEVVEQKDSTISTDKITYWKRKY